MIAIYRCSGTNTKNKKPIKLQIFGASDGFLRSHSFRSRTITRPMAKTGHFTTQVPFKPVWAVHDRTIYLPGEAKALDRKIHPPETVLDRKDVCAAQGSRMR